ncbi:MAG: cytidylate kinase family protein [Nanoarchaeota archaeon]
MKYNSIILSGLPCSGKSTLASLLSQHYCWPIYSIGGIWRERWRIDYPRAEIPFEEYWRSTTPEENRKINVEARKIFEKGKIIGDSRYSSYYCSDLPALMIFVQADIEIRAKRMLNSKKCNGQTLEEIKMILHEREKDEVDIGKKLFNGFDYRNFQYYHLTLDAGKMSPQEEFSHVLSFMEK